MLKMQHLGLYTSNVEMSTSLLYNIIEFHCNLEEERMIERFEHFSVMISEISRCWHKITTTEMEKYGLKGAHSIYLTTMARFPEGITAAKLCELCCKDKSDVSRMMGIMEKNGLVVKEGSYQNRYNGVFLLTEAGKTAAEYVKQRAGLAVSIAGKDLIDESRAILYSALESVCTNLKIICENRLLDDEQQM